MSNFSSISWWEEVTFWWDDDDAGQLYSDSEPTSLCSYSLVLKARSNTYQFHSLENKLNRFQNCQAKKILYPWIIEQFFFAWNFPAKNLAFSYHFLPKRGCLVSQHPLWKEMDSDKNNFKNIFSIGSYVKFAFFVGHFGFPIKTKN